MRYLHSLSICFFAVVLFQSVCLKYCGSTNITDANFEQMVRGKKWMIKFYAPWCGHCKAFEKTWLELAKDMCDSDIYFGEADGTVQTDLSMKFDITGYPSIYYLEDFVSYKFQGKRSVEYLKSFITEGYKISDYIRHLPAGELSTGDKLYYHIEKIINTCQQAARMLLGKVGIKNVPTWVVIFFVIMLFIGPIACTCGLFFWLDKYERKKFQQLQQEKEEAAKREKKEN